MKRKLAAIALALTLLAGTASAAAFTDVDGNHYYAQAVAWAVEQGITTGTTESTFSPGQTCTRGQILTFLWRAAGSPEPESKQSPFADVTPEMNQSFYKAILWANEKGVIASSDLDGGNVLPNAPCDRATTMLFLWRYAGSPMPHVPAVFEDVAADAAYAQAVGWAVENGVTGGVTESHFYPDSICTRGQIVTFLYRSLGAAALEAPIEPPEVPQEPERHPLRTLTGSGNAYSLGLDGSEFTSENAYEAKVQVDVYSEAEAVLTVSVPFPLFQAWDYSVRFTSENDVYTFTCSRWDEAFGDMVSWQGEHNLYRMTVEHTGTPLQAPETIPLEVEVSSADRMGGELSWQVILPPGSGFRFDKTDRYTLSCEVSSGA